MSLLTIFTAPKPFTQPHIRLIQENALRSWKALGDEVEVVVIGDEEGIAEAAAELRCLHVPDVARNASGTPLLSSIFNIGRQATDSPLLAYANADVLLFDDFLTTAKQMLTRLDDFLLVGQRWDLDVQQRLAFSGESADAFFEYAGSNAKLHPRGGSDYFIYPRKCFQSIPDFATGRSGWDNWMFYKARLEGWPLIDATEAITVVHQQHDYSHLPGGKPHYRMPESNENVRLAGGRRTIFTLNDVTHQLAKDLQIQRVPVTGKRILREIETFPLLTLKSTPLANAMYALLHPRKAYREFRQARRSGEAAL